PSPQLVHPNFNDQKCLMVQGTIQDGAPVVIGDCVADQAWTYTPGDTLVRYGLTGYCLDAGSTPANGVGMKIWQCYDTNLQAQHWYNTNDNRIALANQGIYTRILLPASDDLTMCVGLCLDLTNGDTTNGNQVQTWECTDFNTNQVWTKT
ncbi:ricin B lectin domain-containing protein, partial [Cyathus striatus]